MEEYQLITQYSLDIRSINGAQRELINQLITRIYMEPNQAQKNIHQNYEQKAEINNNKLQRQGTRTYELKAFNNWIKAVLIQTQTKRMCRLVQQTLDLRKGDNPILHVLDIGCGRGQDISKWRLARVAYMVVVDFSSECVKSYEQRWKTSRQPYRLYSVVGDFTSKTLYSDIQHSFYDLVSAQFCFHYMFGTEVGLSIGLSSILSNLLVGGVFIATIPDSYTILKKVKQKGIAQGDGSRVYGNKYFSIKFQTTEFTQPYNNMYGFYLEDAVGSKNSEGEITYTNQWLIQLDSLSKILEKHGVQIEETMNFLQYYVKYRNQYKQLFPKFKLIYNVGQAMDPELWQIAHLYRVLICRKKSKGRQIKDFNQKKRIESINNKQIKVSHSQGISYQRNNNFSSNQRNYSNGGYQSRGGDHSRSRDNKSYEHKYYKK